MPMNKATSESASFIPLGKPEAHDIFSDGNRYLDLDDWNRRAVELHDVAGLHKIEREGINPFWAVIDYKAVREIERQPQLFTNAPQARLGTQQQLAQKKANPLRTLIHMDGDEHKQFRGLTDDWFKPNNLRKLDDRLTQLSREAIDKLEQLGGECDFVTDIALEYPLKVILKILGLPEEDYPRMLTLTQEFFGEGDPDLERNAVPEERRSALIKDFMTYFTSLRHERQRCPAHDLASEIANGSIHEQLIGDLEAVSYYVLIATAGHDTTSSAMSGGLHALIEHPQELLKLQSNMELLDNAVEEMLRWTAPVRHFMRTAQEDTEILGQKIKKGDWLYLSYKAANLDPKIFPDPLNFDISRANAKQHLGFGFGVHFCLGAPLARNELRNFFGHLVPRIDSIELAGPTKTTKTIFAGGLKHLPIKYKLTGTSQS